MKSAVAKCMCWDCQYASETTFAKKVPGHPKTVLQYKQCAAQHIDVYEIDAGCDRFEEKDDLF